MRLLKKHSGLVCINRASQKSLQTSGAQCRVCRLCLTFSRTWRICNVDYRAVAHNLMLFRSPELDIGVVRVRVHSFMASWKFGTMAK